MTERDSIKIPAAPAARTPAERFSDAGFVCDYGRLEALRATRFGASFSVILVELDPAAGTPPGMMAESLTGALRSSDVAGALNDRHALVVLPETDYFGSLIAARKLKDAMGRALGGSPMPGIAQATFPRDGTDLGELITRAAARIVEKKEGLRATLGLDGKLFWEVIGDVFSTGHSGAANASFDAGGGHELSELFIDRINELIIKEIRRSPAAKGVLYFSTKEISPGLPIVRVIRDAGMTGTRIFLAGEYESELADLKNATQVHIDDPRLKDTFFTFFLSEDTGYAIILRETWGGAYSCFHTSDADLVEGLIHKFQKEYSLQEQLT